MILDNIAGMLHTKVAAVCPIHGVSIGRRNDKATWSIRFTDEATTEQRAAADAVLAAYDHDAELARPQPKTELELLRERVAVLEARTTTTR